MQPCESVAEYVVDVTVRADREGFADRYADAYDASALRAANDAELAAVPVCTEACLERTYQVHGRPLRCAALVLHDRMDPVRLCYDTARPLPR